MKCAKCGAECDSRQLFCLRCGTPLNADKSEENIIREVELPIEDMVDVMSLDEEDDDIDLIIGRDLSRMNNRTYTAQSGRENYNRQNNKGNYEHTDENTKEYKSSNTATRNDGGNTQKKYAGKKELKYSKNHEVDNDFDNRDAGKKKIIIGAVACVAVLAIVLLILWFVFGGTGKYDEYYKNGMNLYEKGKVQAAATQFMKAADVAKNDDDKIEANAMLWKAYSQLDGYENELIDVLNKLIALEPAKQSYYEALIVVYQGLNDQNSIDTLIESVKDPELKAKLKDFDGTTPVPTVESGEYDKPLTIELTATSGSTIYYTLNGGNASTTSEVYTSSIKLDEEGEYTIKAIAVDSKGKKSRQFEGKYILSFGSVSAPVVSLDSGTYTEIKKIKVTADTGCKIYYTTDGTTPTSESKEYTKAFKMPEKNTIYQFIAIDEKGVSSDVVTRVYSFKREFKFDYDSAVSGISNILIANGTMENDFGTYEDGSAMYFEYESIEEINKEFYYIITAKKESEQGTTLLSETYAFGCNSGEKYKASFSGGKYVLEAIE